MNRCILAVFVAVIALASSASFAQSPAGSADPLEVVAANSGPGMTTPASAGSTADALNPVSVLESAGNAIPGIEGGLSGTLNIIILLTVITLVPTIMVMCTCFIRFAIVLSMLTKAMGTPGLPPTQVTTALVLFMTLFVMTPTIDRIYNEAIVPYQNGEIDNQLEMWNTAKQPVRDFMFAQIEATDNWSTVFMLLNYRGVDTSEPQNLTRADVDTITLIPAYMLSELETAFLMGFRVYLPFLIVDMILASVLISMSMMMLPPVLISLPFKVMLFLLVDGWTLVVGSLMTSVAPVAATGG